MSCYLQCCEVEFFQFTPKLNAVRSQVILIEVHVKRNQKSHVMPKILQSVSSNDFQVMRVKSQAFQNNLRVS